MLRRTALGLLLSLSLGVPGAQALEVDPYLAWLAEIPDSAEVLNEYTNARISGRLQTLAESPGKADTCPAVATAVLKSLHRSVFTGRPALRFLKKSQRVSTWKDGNGWTAVWRSYYRRLPFLYFSSIARTIDVNGIRMSLDKIGHFFSFGRRYYKRYRRAIAKGASPAEAERSAIAWGIRQENLFVGKWIDTIFSHADLEANYQGLRFARDLCEGESPYLERVDGVWSLARDVDLRDYMTPGFDEGFNTNHFTRLGWWLVRGPLKRHCPVLDRPEVRRRLDFYRSFGGPSASQLAIREFFAERGKDPQSRHSLQTLCAAEGAAAAAPAKTVPAQVAPGL